MAVTVSQSLRTPAFREERGLSMSENGVLSRIFGFKGDEVTGGWRNLSNEELHNLQSPSYDIKIIKLRKGICAVHVACME
jgi:hypothetical protein